MASKQKPEQTKCKSCGKGIKLTKKGYFKEYFECTKCGAIVCSSHYYHEVDGNNIAITKSLEKLGMCEDCFNIKSNRRFI